MKTAYLDCYSGISGDMTLASLMDAGASMERVQQVVHSMGLTDVYVRVSPTTKKGFRGNLLHISHPREAVHRNLTDIVTLIRRGSMSTNAKSIALRLFERLARAEAIVHGTTIDRVHFHEVGAIDSIVDMVGVAVAWDELEIEKGVASPVPTGTGTIRIAHGLVSLPAPATAELLKDIPIAPCGLPLEMTTPTGAVILAELIDEFGPMPSMQVNRIGYGAGQRDVPDRPNLLRILIGHSISLPPKSPSAKDKSVPSKSAAKPENSASDTQDDSIDYVWVMETNLDDITGEEIGYAIEKIWELGPLDVFTTPIFMKKNRPGTLLTVLCRRSDRQKIETVILEHTGTLGLRVRRQERVVLPRAQTEVDTPWGLIPGKVSMLPSGDVQFSPEYEDCRLIANENGIRLRDVVAEVEACYRASEQLRRTDVDEVDYSDEHYSKRDDSSLDPKEIDQILAGDDSSINASLDVNNELQQAAFEDREDWIQGAEDTTETPRSEIEIYRQAWQSNARPNNGGFETDWGSEGEGKGEETGEYQRNLSQEFVSDGEMSLQDATNMGGRSRPLASQTTEDTSRYENTIHPQSLPSQNLPGENAKTPKEILQDEILGIGREETKEMFIDEDVWYRWDSSPWKRPTDS